MRTFIGTALAMAFIGAYLALAMPVKTTAPDGDLVARVTVLETQVKELRCVVGLEGKEALEEGLQNKLRRGTK